ncbi:hypothetical protein N4R57_17885 [Rhodobacteraceae bacterium D3-12]|nr:hypothetical protein N4R57_17885 [Rhodobacteraceae bacterium D3-12]
MRICVWLMILGLLLPLRAGAEERLVRVHVPDRLEQTGLMRHILPRFSLKTQVRVEVVGAGDAPDLIFGSEGRAVFRGIGEVWHIKVVSEGHAGTGRLVKWLRSDVGQRTVFGFAPEGAAMFSAPEVAVVEAVAVAPSGDVALGLRASRAKCGRCHVVARQSGLGGIGSTPSFAVLRSLPDWEGRFAAFYALNPHPAFTQIEDVTEPFAEERPSPIAPVVMTMEEVEAIMAYVTGMTPANLGKPLEHQ